MASFTTSESTSASLTFWTEKYTLSEAQLTSFTENGFLVLRDVFSGPVTSSIQQWSKEVYSWPNEKGKWMPYQERRADGSTGLCRTENFVDYHSGFNDLLRDDRLRGILEQIQGEDMVLFKEKINYKEAGGSGGFDAHIDAPAYQHAGVLKHLTVNIAVDAATPENGCLHVVPGSHKTQIPIDNDNCIDQKWEDAQTWFDVELNAGDVLIFGSFLAHRSGPNNSSSPRAAIYATFNAVSDEGDMREAYYIKRRREWPPTFERQDGQDYTVGAKLYGFGSPMAGPETHSRLMVERSKLASSLLAPTA